MRIVLVILFLVPILSYSQQSDGGDGQSRMEYYLNVYKQTDGNTSLISPFLTFVEKLDQKEESFRNPNDFLAYIFHKTHQRFLRHFAEDASFGQLLTDHTYNCLTATALYALLLDHFSFDYKIIETNYHIFMLTETSQGAVLLETTDPTGGFVTDPNEIENRIEHYRANRIQVSTSDDKTTHYRYKVDLYNEVNLDELLGLLYYNLSVKAYNQQKLPIAIEQLERATTSYQSDRVEEFSRILLLSIVESDFENHVKAAYLRNIQALRKNQFSATASYTKLAIQ